MASTSSQDTSYLSQVLLAASCLYQTVRDFNPVLRKGFEFAEEIPSNIMNSKIGTWAFHQQELLNGYQNIALDKLHEQKQFYVSVARSWLKADSIEEYIRHLEDEYGSRWNASLSRLARQFYDQCSRIPMVEDALFYVAFALSEGSEQISNAMVAAWQELKVLSPRSYVTILKKKLGGYWNEDLRERARVFYSIASVDNFKTQVDQAATSAQDLMRRSRSAAEQTSFILFEAVDRLTFWTIDSMDTYFVAYIAPPSAEDQNLKGSRRLKSIAQRLKTEVTGLVKGGIQTVSETAVAKRLDKSLSISSKIESIQEGFNYISTMTKAELMEKTWPEDCKLMVDRVCNVLHVSFLSSQFNVRVWAKLDYDADGKVTVGDLAMTMQQAKEVGPREGLRRLWAKLQSARESGPVVINGELSS